MSMAKKALTVAATAAAVSALAYYIFGGTKNDDDDSAPDSLPRTPVPLPHVLDGSSVESGRCCLASHTPHPPLADAH
jgi:hypothetical protein